MSQHDTATEQVLEAVTKYPLLHVKQEPVEPLEEQALQLESRPRRFIFSRIKRSKAQEKYKGRGMSTKINEMRNNVQEAKQVSDAVLHVMQFVGHAINRR
jgi:hypothetical protein